MNRYSIRAASVAFSSRHAFPQIEFCTSSLFFFYLFFVLFLTLSRFFCRLLAFDVENENGTDDPKRGKRGGSSALAIRRTVIQKPAALLHCAGTTPVEGQKTGCFAPLTTYIRSTAPTPIAWLAGARSLLAPVMLRTSGDIGTRRRFISFGSCAYREILRLPHSIFSPFCCFPLSRNSFFFC